MIGLVQRVREAQVDIEGRTVGAIGPGPNIARRIRQVAYPYAKPHPLTYMRPGQPFWEGDRTYGGWFRADLSLRRILGLPARPRASD